MKMKLLEKNNETKKRKIWKLVLTGGPCGGKTTGQARLSTFFENLGWKVYRVPEASTTLKPGGVNFGLLSAHGQEKFQENLLKTMMQMETTFFDLADCDEGIDDRNVLIICDRGSMDASAFIPRHQWENILTRNVLDEVEMRDNRYNQVIHMMTAAKGAESFYTTEDHVIRDESLDGARELDIKAAEAWVGHPNVCVIDNSCDFETKINILISKVAWSIGIDIGDRLRSDSKKLKFVVNGPLPNREIFPKFQDFDVCHHYLQTSTKMLQNRLRRRGRNGKWSYTHTTRKLVSGQVIEVKTNLNHRDYVNLLEQSNEVHFPVFKTRRCFIYNNQYFQLDIYKDPCHHRCKGLMLLETYTASSGDDLREKLPTFLNLGDNVTGDPAFSMFNLSLKKDWANNAEFCHSLSDNEVDDGTATKNAEDRLAKTKSKGTVIKSKELNGQASFQEMKISGAASSSKTS